VDQNARITPPADDDERAAARREHARVDAELVVRARGDDPEAFGQLYARWFERVNDLAFRITRDASVAPEVAQDVFVSAWQGLGGLDQPESFGGWLLRITRNTALNRRRKELRSSPRDTEGMAVIEATRAPDVGAPAGFRVEDRTVAAGDPARAAADAEIAALVWESAEALGERDAEVLDLTLRHGLTPAEVGDVIGINRNAANQTVHRVRARLKNAVQARVLWRGGEPVCGDLADALEAEGVRGFGPDAVRVATAHAETCAQCGRRRALKLEPSALFAATPFVALPLLKTEIAHALAAQGVPMGEIPDVSPPVDAPSGARRRRWRNRLLAGVAVVVLAFVVVGVLAEDIEEFATGKPSEGRRRVTTTTAPAPTTTAAPVVIPPAPTVITVPPPPAPPPITATISIAPPTAANSTFPRPTLTWSTQNASAVEVFGPNFSSSAPSGSATVCPGSPVGPVCTAPPGPYAYTIRARDAEGNVVAEQTVIFTKTP